MRWGDQGGESFFCSFFTSPGPSQPTPAEGCDLSEPQILPATCLLKYCTYYRGFKWVVSREVHLERSALGNVIFLQTETAAAPGSPCPGASGPKAGSGEKREESKGKLGSYVLLSAMQKVGTSIKKKMGFEKLLFWRLLKWNYL